MHLSSYLVHLLAQAAQGCILYPLEGERAQLSEHFAGSLRNMNTSLRTCLHAASCPMLAAKRVLASAVSRVSSCSAALERMSTYVFFAFLSFCVHRSLSLFLFFFLFSYCFLSVSPILVHGLGLGAYMFSNTLMNV